MKTVLLEGLAVALVGATLAFAANALSPHGLNLARNYFPGAVRPNTTVAVNNTNQPNSTVLSSGSDTPNAQLAARLQSKGLKLAGQTQVRELFQDPRKEQNQVLFVDARNDEHYLEGHIPGAYQLDYYHPENFLPTLLPLCQAAQQVVVYCNGGECEDSELAATMLRDAGIPPDKLLVYGGGITEWEKIGAPIELDGRGSGKLRSPAK